MKYSDTQLIQNPQRIRDRIKKIKLQNNSLLWIPDSFNLFHFQKQLEQFLIMNTCEDIWDNSPIPKLLAWKSHRLQSKVYLSTEVVSWDSMLDLYSNHKYETNISQIQFQAQVF